MKHVLNKQYTEEDRTCMYLQLSIQFHSNLYIMVCPFSLYSSKYNNSKYNVPSTSHSLHMFISVHYTTIHGRNHSLLHAYSEDKWVIMTVNLLCKFSIWLHISILTTCLYFVLITWYVNHINITFWMSVIPLASLYFL